MPKASKDEINLLQSIWVPVRVAVERTHFSRSTILRIVADKSNGCRSFLWKSHPDNQSGRLLLNLPDLINFISTQAERAEAAKASLEELK